MNNKCFQVLEGTTLRGVHHGELIIPLRMKTRYCDVPWSTVQPTIRDFPACCALRATGIEPVSAAAVPYTFSAVANNEARRSPGVCKNENNSALSLVSFLPKYERHSRRMARARGYAGVEV